MAGSKVKRGKYSWLLSYYEGIDPKTGKKKYYRETFKVPEGTSPKESEKLASLRLAEIITDKNRQEFVDPSKIKFINFLIDTWLPVVKAEKSFNTYKEYHGVVYNHIQEDSIAKIPLTQIELAHIDDFKIRKLTSPRADGRKGELSPKTVNNMLIVIKAALTYACERRTLKFSPAHYAKPLKYKKYEAQTWNEDEAARFLDVAFYDRFYFLFLLALFYGKRLGEWRALKQSDIDLKLLTASIRRSVIKDGNSAKFKETKTESSEVLELEPWMVPFFEREFNERKKEKLAYGPGYHDNDLVFASLNGNVVKERFIREHFKTCIDRAKVPEIRFHDTRHTCITVMLKRGWSLKHAQERANHSSIQTTGNTYSHVTPKMQRDVNADLAKAYKLRVPQTDTQKKIKNKKSTG